MQHLDDGRLQAWLDRDRSGIDAGEAAEIERHVARCDACAARLAELEALNDRSRSILQSAGPIDADVPDFRAVVERSRRAARAPRRARPWMAAGWAASVVAALGLGWLTNDLYRADRGVEPRPAAEAEASAVAAARDTDAPAAEAIGDAPSPAEEARIEPPAAAAGEGGEPAAVAAAPGRAEAALAAEPAPEPAEAAPAAPRPAPAPEDAVVVRGRVTNDQDVPVASARVFVPGAAVGDLTGEDGTFSLSLSPSAADPTTREVTLAAQRIGFRSARREIALGAADTVTADFRLSPAALALEEMVVTGTPGRRGAVRTAATDEARAEGDARADEWTPASRAEAEDRAGFTLLTLPGLEILAIEVGEVDGATVVRLRQALPSGADLTLIQRAGAASPAGVAATLDGRPAVSTRKGELLVTASAPIGLESLRVLLDRLR